MPKPQAVIFDMDGVIVDSESRHEQAFLDTVERIGYGQTHGINFQNYVGRSDRELWQEFLSRHQPGYSAEELLRMKSQRVIEILQRDQPLFEGLPELIEQLAARYRLALASGSDRIIVEAVLDLGGLRRYFPVTVSCNDVARGKPAPDIFLRAAGQLGVPPRDCWVIEDSKPGVAAGRAAGMTVVAITNTHPAEELAEADFVVATYPEIARLLQ
jgi:HAD superfamily hydrolase (TIGR01509 family)